MLEELCIKKGVKRFDLFSQKIMLTYKGESSFSTFLGGFLSLIIFTIVSIYGIVLLQTMINRGNSNSSKSTEVVDLTTNDEDYYPTDYGFSFAVIVSDLYGRPLALDPTYFSLQLAEGTFVQSGALKIPTYIQLGYKLCELSDLPGMTEELFKKGAYSSMYCPVNKRYRVGGNYFSNNFHYASIKLQRCVGTGCQSSAVIDAALQKMVVTFIYVNSYMDFNDYANPVKINVDDRFSYYLQPSYEKYIRMYAKLNKATLDDDYLMINSAIEKKFFSIDRSHTDGANSDLYVFDASLLMDPNRDLYQRKVFTILDLFGTIGGIFGLLKSALGFIIGFISSQILLSSVFRRLYYTNQQKSNQPPENVDKDEEDSFKEELKEDISFQTKREKKNGSKPADESNTNLQNIDEEYDDNNIVNSKEIVNKLKCSLNQRKKYQASWLHKILTFIPSWVCKNYKGLMRK